MMPVLIDIRLLGLDFPLPTYGTLLALAFLAALWMATRQARLAGVEPGIVTDLWITSLLAGIVGAKLLLYMLDLDYYLANPRAILTHLRSAGVFYGGLAAAIAAGLILVRRRGASAWLLGDIVAPAIALGQAVGRVGCFAAGCCWGTPSSLPWAVTFTNPRAAEFTGVPLEVALHPVQLYLSLADLLLCAILIVVASRKRFTGQVLLLYLILYAILRGLLEVFRGDPRGALWGLSTSQIASLLLGLIALWLYLGKRRQAASGR